MGANTIVSLSPIGIKRYIQSRGLASFFAITEEALLCAAREAMVNENKARFVKCAERINLIYRDAMKSLLE